MRDALEKSILFISKRAWTLWGLTMITVAPIALTVWLLNIGPPGRIDAEFGAVWIGWIFRSALVLVSTVTFLPMLWLSGRYVLRASG